MQCHWHIIQNNQVAYRGSTRDAGARQGTVPLRFGGFSPHPCSFEPKANVTTMALSSH
jgi:hypothetical protein